MEIIEVPLGEYVPRLEEVLAEARGPEAAR